MQDMEFCEYGSALFSEVWLLKSMDDTTLVVISVFI